MALTLGALRIVLEHAQDTAFQRDYDRHRDRFENFCGSCGVTWHKDSPMTGRDHAPTCPLVAALNEVEAFLQSITPAPEPPPAPPSDPEPDAP